MCPTLHFIHEDRLVYVSLGKNIMFALFSLVFFFFFFGEMPLSSFICHILSQIKQKSAAEWRQRFAEITNYLSDCQAAKGGN